nr:hypothetical protein [uncultured Sphaerochaeta sp.]
MIALLSTAVPDCAKIKQFNQSRKNINHSLPDIAVGQAAGRKQRNLWEKIEQKLIILDAPGKDCSEKRDY